MDAFVIDPDSAVPPFEQLRSQVATRVARGDLPPGTRLPTVRQTASDLRLAVNTVARAYRELEIAGVVTKRRTAGTFVADAVSPLARRERLKIIGERVDALVAESRQMNIDLDAVIELIQERDAALQPAAVESTVRKRRNES